MKTLGLICAWALVSSSAAVAQTATLTALDAKLNRSGGEVTLTASVSYDGAPGAIGWSIVVPADWTLVRVVGPHVPAIAAEPGASGTLEFAHATIPAGRAEFQLTLRYPAGTPAARVTSTTLVRTGGILKTLNPAPVTFQAP